MSVFVGELFGFLLGYLAVVFEFLLLFTLWLGGCLLVVWLMTSLP